MDLMNHIRGVTHLRTCVCESADPEGGGGGRGSGPHLKNYKNIGYLSNTGQDPLKSTKLPKPAFNVGHQSARQRNAIYICKWRFAGEPMMVRFSGIWSLSPLIN